MRRSDFAGKSQWAGLFRPCLCFVALALAAVSCDTETMDFGSIDKIQNIVTEEDMVVSGTVKFYAHSWTDSLGSIRAKNRKCYFGQVTDPENLSVMRAEYVAQLHCFEGASFPSMDSLMTVTADKKAQCDSVELIMYYDTWYGDKNAPLKVNVIPLDCKNVLPSDSVFYTDVDVTKYLAKPATVLASKVITAWDNTLSETSLKESTHAHCARVMLPREFGNDIMNKYYASPSSFENTYKFLRNVCAGFYLQLADGDGAMLGVTSTSLNVYYRYKYNTGTKDTIYNAYTNFVGSAEVVQATNFKCTSLSKLVDDVNCTYVKSPAGLYTELHLPVNDMMKGHEQDSLARVQLSLTRYNSYFCGEESSSVVFNTPQTLCMVMKSELKSFFEKGYDLVMQRYATADFASVGNMYNFSNINRLVKYIYEAKTEGMKKSGLSESEWIAKNPDWDKVALVPVTVTTNNTTVVDISHDMSITSTRLVGGKNPIEVYVTYSRY